MMKKYITPESSVMLIGVCRCLNASQDLRFGSGTTITMDAKARDYDDEPTNYKVGGGAADDELDALW